MPLFGMGKKSDSPATLVKDLVEVTGMLSDGGAADDPKAQKNAEKACEEAGRVVGAIKVLLYGDPTHEAKDEDGEEILREFVANDIVQLLIDNLRRYPFEARKDAVSIISNLLRRRSGDKEVLVEHLNENAGAVAGLVRAYVGGGEAALVCGMLVRELARYEALLPHILAVDEWWNLFELMRSPDFNISSDALATVRELLTRHKAVVGPFLEANYERVVDEFGALLECDVYLVKREALKLLGELLFENSNKSYMRVRERFVSSREQLKRVMTLLIDTSPQIALEAFHVAKLFLVNPSKPSDVLDILLRNQERLSTFIENFCSDMDDDAFQQQKQFLLSKLQREELEAQLEKAKEREEKEAKEAKEGGGKKEGKSTKKKAAAAAAADSDGEEKKGSDGDEGGEVAASGRRRKGTLKKKKKATAAAAEEGGEAS